jgi:uncharacterized sporulation protein YeaH/YhbH (DUF444 family)
MKKIGRDHAEFRNLVDGKIYKELKDRISNGSISRLRPNGGKAIVSIPRLSLPRFVHGRSKEGVGQGPGKPGDVVGKDPQKGDKGTGAGTDPADGIEVQVDMEEVIKILEAELQLPRLLPKPNETFEEIKKRYNSLAKTGPRSMIHRRATMKKAIKRIMASGGVEHKILPGFSEPMPVLTPINDDLRYRQYKEYKIPTSNAVIFFCRDGSGSMDDEKCEIVSDMAYWIDLWVRHHYKRTERVYVWHDTEAREVGSDTFYKLRMGGGTMCSSAMTLINELIDSRYNPQKYNIYLFYFGDGENYSNDNKKFFDILKKDLYSKINFFGTTQILSYSFRNSLHESILQQMKDSPFSDPGFMRMAYVGGQQSSDGGGYNPSYGYNKMPEEERNKQVIEAIKALLGKESKLDRFIPMEV